MSKKGKKNEGDGKKISQLGEKQWLKVAVEKAAAEEWWAKCLPGQKLLARQLALMIEEVTESKRLEIWGEGSTVQVRFFRLLKEAEKGCGSAIMLPEAEGVMWN